MVSLSTTASITIDREPADVWAYVSDVRNQDHWVDGMSDSEIIGEGAIGRGTRIRRTYTFEGRSSPMTIEITEFSEDRRLGIESSDGPFPITGLLTLERSGSGTTVTNAMTAGSDHIMTTVMFTLLRPLSRMFFKRQLSKELGQLKSILEACA